MTDEARSCYHLPDPSETLLGPYRRREQHHQHILQQQGWRFPRGANRDGDDYWPGWASFGHKNIETTIIYTHAVITPGKCTARTTDSGDENRHSDEDPQSCLVQGGADLARVWLGHEPAFSHAGGSRGPQAERPGLRRLDRRRHRWRDRTLVSPRASMCMAPRSAGCGATCPSRAF